jgi:lipopolysaccharide biosynthesis regulator YciM
MAKTALRLSMNALVILVLSLSLNVHSSHAAGKPLRKAQLLALVAGNGLDTTVIAEIRRRGINFTPDATYKSLLKQAGAPDGVLDALDKAKINPAASSTPEDAELLKHLAQAGSLSKAGNNDEAAAQLSAALSQNASKLDAGFVMTHVLLDQQRVEEASAILTEILAQDPDYPCIEMRLSYEPAPKPGVTQRWYDAQQKYKLAQERFQAHLAQLRGSGKAPEANDLEARLRAKESSADPDEKFHAAMQATKQALMERRLDDAETSAKQAVSIAEKIQPMDGRLPEALGQLGGVYASRRDFTNAFDIFHRQLALSEKLYGAQSPEISSALRNLGAIAAAQQNFAEAEKYFTRSVDLNVKTYGENAEPVAEALRSLAHLYFQQKDFAKAESTLQRSAHIYETVYGENDQRLVLPLTMLCFVYDQSNQPDKSQACHARMVTLGEKQFGANSPNLVRDLAAEAQALRQLGRNDEAAKLEQRAQSLQSAQTAPGPMSPMNPQ